MMEENAQMSLLPDAVAAAQMTMTGEEEIDLSEYEIVRPEFFAHIKEPALTVNVDKIGVNTACVRLMPDVEYVQILVNRKEKKLLLKPCDEIEITGYRWGKTKEGKRYPTQRTGELFVLTICELMDWNPDYRYSEILSFENQKQMLIPRGFAHGYLTLEDDTLMQWCVDNDFCGEAARAVRYDSDFIWQTEPWPMQEYTLSEKDKNAIKLSELRKF